MDAYGMPRIRRKSSAIKVLSRANTFTTSSGATDELDPDAASPPAPGSSGTSGGGGGVGGNHSLPNVPYGSLSTALEHLRRTVQKRITTWAYLRSAHQGQVFWFNTVLLSKEELAAAFENSKMRTRTTRFAVLGMSLSSLLDISAAHDFLRGLLSLVQEFDSVTDDKFDHSQKNKSVFRVNSRAKKGGGGTGGADFSISLPETGETSYLFAPNIPFELDYFQVLFTTCDMLAETYTKILSYLGPSNHHNSVPAGFPQPPGSSSNLGGSAAAAGLSPALTEVVLKIDSRLTKLIALLTKDVDAVARKSIKHELESLAGADWGLDAGMNDGA